MVIDINLIYNSVCINLCKCSRKEPGGGYDMAEFDQALFLYLNSQDQASVIQDQPRKPHLAYAYT